MGCLLNVWKLKQDSADVQVRHVAEVLAGMTGTVVGEAEWGDAGSNTGSSSQCASDRKTEPSGRADQDEDRFVDRRRRGRACRIRRIAIGHVVKDHTRAASTIIWNVSSAGDGAISQVHCSTPEDARQTILDICRRLDTPKTVTKARP